MEIITLYFVQYFGPLLVPFFFLLNYAVEGTPSTQLDTERVRELAGDRSSGLRPQVRAPLSSPAGARSCMQPCQAGRVKEMAAPAPRALLVPAGA